MRVAVRDVVAGEERLWDFVIELVAFILGVCDIDIEEELNVVNEAVTEVECNGEIVSEKLSDEVVLKDVALLPHVV